jgi:DNA-binding response OmpR family regulator
VKTILVVDDDPSILRAVEAFLKIKGFRVLTSLDPAEGFKMANDKKPDLIISDIAMPGIDGFTLLANLRENKATSRTPLVLLTATDRISDVEKGFSSGAQAYILKPIDWDRAWSKLKPFLT